MRLNLRAAAIVLPLVATLAANGAAREVESFTKRLNAGYRGVLLKARKQNARFRLHWNGDGYVCRDAEGKLGYNTLEVRELLRTKQAECADLSGSLLRYADLFGADLRGARLVRSDLTGANLLGASLNGAQLTGSDLSVANLGGAQLIAVEAPNTRLRMAVLDDARLTKADLSDADLSSAHLSGAELSGADLARADLTKTHLRNATYDNQTKLPFDEAEAGERGMFRIHR